MRWTRRTVTCCFGDAVFRCVSVAVLAVMLMATGCSEDNPPAAEGGATSEPVAPESPSVKSPSVESPSAESSDEVESGAGSEPSSSTDSDVDILAEHLGIYVHDDNADFYASMELRKQRQLDRNQLIAGCMADRGFEHIADDPDVVLGYHDGFVMDRNSQEWASRYGFGVTTLMWSQEVLADDAVGYPGRAPATPSVGDPLATYLETLDDPERYWTALFGPEPDPETGEYASTSCAGVAARTVPDPGRQAALVAQRLVGGEGGDPSTVLLERLAVDDWVVRRQQTGEQCLADAGFTFTDELDARIDIWNRRGELPKFDELNNLASADPALRSDYLDALSELQAYEVLLAEAVWECQVAQPQLDRLKVSVLATMLG